MSLHIHTIEDVVVRKVSTRIAMKDISKPETQQFVDELIEAMIQYKGIGIAAVQAGRPICMIVIAKEYAEEATRKVEHLVLVNPRIVSTSEKKSVMEEGCLSVPATFGPIERYAKVRVKAVQRDGTPIDIKAKGMLARILQHEIDHLHGKVFIDSALSVHYE